MKAKRKICALEDPILYDGFEKERQRLHMIGHSIYRYGMTIGLAKIKAMNKAEVKKLL